MRLVLASSSPARRATLAAAGLPFDVVVSGVDEDAVGAAAGPPSVAELTHVLAAAKAADVASRTTGDAVVLGCDSLLELDGAPLGKPGSDAAVTARWSELAGRTAVLHTGHCVLVLAGDAVVRTAERVASTSVTFRRPTPDEVAAYVATGEPQQVAGGFTIDGLGGWFVDRIEGDHHAVVGLSLPVFRDLLHEVGVGLIELGWPAS
ncbi:Maf family protein [Jatrophihabitans sp. YIM 134969]